MPALASAPASEPFTSGTPPSRSWSRKGSHELRAWRRERRGSRRSPCSPAGASPRSRRCPRCLLPTPATAVRRRRGMRPIGLQRWLRGGRGQRGATQRLRAAAGGGCTWQCDVCASGGAWRSGHHGPRQQCLHRPWGRGSIGPRTSRATRLTLRLASRATSRRAASCPVASQTIAVSAAPALCDTL